MFEIIILILTIVSLALSIICLKLKRDKSYYKQWWLEEQQDHIDSKIENRDLKDKVEYQKNRIINLNNELDTHIMNKNVNKTIVDSPFVVLHDSDPKPVTYKVEKNRKVIYKHEPPVKMSHSHVSPSKNYNNSDSNSDSGIDNFVMGAAIGAMIGSSMSSSVSDPDSEPSYQAGGGLFDGGGSSSSWDNNNSSSSDYSSCDSDLCSCD